MCVWLCTRIYWGIVSQCSVNRTTWKRRKKKRKRGAEPITFLVHIPSRTPHLPLLPILQHNVGLDPINLSQFIRHTDDNSCSSTRSRIVRWLLVVGGSVTRRAQLTTQEKSKYRVWAGHLLWRHWLTSSIFCSRYFQESIWVWPLRCKSFFNTRLSCKCLFELKRWR